MNARHLARFSLVLSLALSLLAGAQSPPGAAKRLRAGGPDSAVSPLRRR